jgi:ubiquinone/menaquinone biosynthesis C-methylase UbiE
MIRWQDPLSGLLLEPIISARTPAGVPISGALRIAGTSSGYPIVDCVVRLTPELAKKYSEWLSLLSLTPPKEQNMEKSQFQTEATVDSFGWQWTWNENMRTARDLQMRVADNFQFKPADFKSKVVLDAGSGAGDQSGYLLQQGAMVLSADLSSSIEVVARKLRMNSGWVGVQCDVTAFPIENDQFDIVYCEGVIQHTQDSKKTVDELCRVTKRGGKILARHYVRPEANTALRKLRRKITLGYYNCLRKRLSRLDRFKLLFVTGIFATLNYLPLIGGLLRISGTALYYKLQPDFKTTWTNTFDYYGNHEFQRFITSEEFWDYFEKRDDIELILKDVGTVVAMKVN